MEPEQEGQLIRDYAAGQLPAVRRQGRGCLAKLLFKLLAVGVFGVVVLYGVLAITAPWSFHIGGRWTPLATWNGYGQLVTEGGIAYPLYVSFFPSSHFSQLHREGLRPTGGLQGSGWICTSPGTTERLTLSGTIYGGWRSTDGSLMTFRLVEARIFDTGQDRGFFDLAGRWQGPKLVMEERGDHGELGHPFRSGLRIDHASVSLNWGSYSDFKNVCANAAKYPAHQ